MSRYSHSKLNLFLWWIFFYKYSYCCNILLASRLGILLYFNSPPIILNQICLVKPSCAGFEFCMHTCLATLMKVSSRKTAILTPQQSWKANSAFYYQPLPYHPTQPEVTVKATATELGIKKNSPWAKRKRENPFICLFLFSSGLLF